MVDRALDDAGTPIESKDNARMREQLEQNTNAPGISVCEICGCPSSVVVARLEQYGAASKAQGGTLSPSATDLHEPPWGAAISALIFIVTLFLTAPVVITRNSRSEALKAWALFKKK